MFKIAKGTKQLITGRYYNANYYAVAIVASITEEIDWAAYIGAPDYRLPEAEAAKYVRDYGCKLSETDARHYFPDIKLHYRR